MEKKLCIKNFAAAAITAVTYLPPKREVVAGFEGIKEPTQLLNWAWGFYLATPPSTLNFVVTCYEC